MVLAWQELAGQDLPVELVLVQQLGQRVQQVPQELQGLGELWVGAELGVLGVLEVQLEQSEQLELLREAEVAEEVEELEVVEQPLEEVEEEVVGVQQLALVPEGLRVQVRVQVLVLVLVLVRALVRVLVRALVWVPEVRV